MFFLMLNVYFDIILFPTKMIQKITRFKFQQDMKTFFATRSQSQNIPISVPILAHFPGQIASGASPKWPKHGPPEFDLTKTLPTPSVLIGQ